jgi:hypothetical protein
MKIKSLAQMKTVNQTNVEIVGMIQCFAKGWCPTAGCPRGLAGPPPFFIFTKALPLHFVKRFTTVTVSNINGASSQTKELHPLHGKMVHQ